MTTTSSKAIYPNSHHPSWEGHNWCHIPSGWLQLCQGYCKPTVYIWKNAHKLNTKLNWTSAIFLEVANSSPAHMRQGAPQPPPGWGQVAPRSWSVGGAVRPPGEADAPGWANPPPPSASAMKQEFSLKFIFYTAKFLNLVWLREADPSLPGWGGWSAPPPSAGGGRPAIQAWMKFILLNLAKRLRRPHVRGLWTGSAFSTDESAWNVMVTGSQSRVWSGLYQPPYEVKQAHQVSYLK